MLELLDLLLIYNIHSNQKSAVQNKTKKIVILLLYNSNLPYQKYLYQNSFLF